MEREEIMKEWIREHSDTLIVVGLLLAGFYTMYEKINNTDRRLSDQIHCLDKRIAVIETVMVMEGKLPKQQSLACEGKDAVD